MPTVAYRPSIDGLRAFAVLSVVGFHAFPGYVSGGFIGVDIFFVISGYLITNSLLMDQTNDCNSIIQFYQRRIRRIFPALGLVIATCLAFGWVALLADEYTYLGLHAAGGASFVSNLVYWNEAGYFDYSSELKPLLHLWSLGIEEQFYIFYPVLLIIIWRSRLPLKATIAVLTFISFWIANTQIATDPVASFYSPVSRGWELLVGGLLATSQDAIKMLTYKRYADIASLIGLFLLIAGVIGMTELLSI
jgi:peptidoglycan/LPS O-acetylase OafA/YrhL